MEGFKVEKVTDVPGYSAKQTKRKKSIARVALAILTGLIIGSTEGCSDPPLPGIPVSSPKINIYVQLSAIDNAQDLYEPAGGVTNAIYAVGNFGGLKVNGVVIPTWDPASAVAQLTRVDSDLYMLQLENTLTNNFTLDFKFVNGTPGFGGTFANEEQEFQDDGSGYEGISDRQPTIFPAYSYWDSTNIYMTNDVVSNIGYTANGCITHWKGVTPTYKCTNVTFNITFKNNIITNVGGTNISPGDYVLLHGSFYYSSTAITSNQVQADNSVTMTFLYFGGSSIVSYLICPSQGFSAQRSYDNYGSDFIFSIPFAQSISGSVFITNSGVWRSW